MIIVLFPVIAIIIAILFCIIKKPYSLVKKICFIILILNISFMSFFSIIFFGTYNILFLIIGLIGFCLSQLVFKDNELVNYVNVVCMILFIYSLKQLAIKYRFVRRLIALMLVIFCFFIIWLG